MKFLNLSLFLSLTLLPIISSLKCIKPEESTANITSWVNENTTLLVNGKHLDVAYCADVINWPISEETLYNWTYYDQGILSIFICI